FQPSPNKWESRKELRFLFIGGLSYRKESGVERNLKGGVTLLRAWKKAISNLSYFPNNLELSFAGPEVTPELVSKILNDEDPKKYKIKVLGEISNNLVIELMAKAHVVIIPSLAEGLPNAAVEALSSGCALIGSEIGGIPE